MNAEIFKDASKTNPSGVVANSIEVAKRILGFTDADFFWTTKTITEEEREGNKEPIFIRITSDYCEGIEPSYGNAVGLKNPGVDKFVDSLKKSDIQREKIMASIAGKDEFQFGLIAEKLVDYVGAFELNISCPHAEKMGQAVGQDYELVERIVKKVKTMGLPVIVKLSPNLDIEKSMEAIIKGGSDGVTAINTIGPKEFMIDDRSILFNGKGGISGKYNLEEGIKIVKQVREIANRYEKDDFIIIACGGITIAEDIVRYKKAGANIVAPGSAALVEMSTKEIEEYYNTINGDIKNGTNEAAKLLKDTSNMFYRKLSVKENRQLADDLFVLRFDQKIDAQAGQFVMMGQLGKNGEKPFSVYSNDPFEVLFQVRGCRTKEMAKLETGDGIYVRGPFGNSPDVEGKLLLVGGGMGIAALKLFTEDYKNTVVVAGVKDVHHLPKINNWKTSETIIYSNDGSVGIKGNATDNLEQIIIDHQPDYILGCGPKGMLDQLIVRGSKLMAKENILVSEELETMCGVGICGRCATKDGRRNCVDGTFL
jgi:dihydroorotate dehydrogenase (NAD+) catalytic subunit